MADQPQDTCSPSTTEAGFVLKLHLYPDKPHTISLESMFGATAILMWTKQITTVYLETLVDRAKSYTPCQVEVAIGLKVLQQKPQRARVALCQSQLTIDNPDRMIGREKEIQDFIESMRVEFVVQLRSFEIPGITF